MYEYAFSSNFYRASGTHTRYLVPGNTNQGMYTYLVTSPETQGSVGCNVNIQKIIFQYRVVQLTHTRSSTYHHTIRNRFLGCTGTISNKKTSQLAHLGTISVPVNGNGNRERAPAAMV